MLVNWCQKEVSRLFFESINLIRLSEVFNQFANNACSVLIQTCTMKLRCQLWTLNSAFQTSLFISFVPSNVKPSESFCIEIILFVSNTCSQSVLWQNPQIYFWMFVLFWSYICLKRSKFYSYQLLQLHFIVKYFVGFFQTVCQGCNCTVA